MQSQMNKEINTRLRTAIRYVAAGVLFTGCAIRGGPAARQPGIPPPPHPLECCQCIGKESPESVILLNTGAAPWMFVSTSSGPVTPYPAVVVAPYLGWTTALSPSAQWVAPSLLAAQWFGSGSNPTGGAGPGNYGYRLTFDARYCVIPSTITISGKFAADNAAQMSVDGNFVAQTPGFGSAFITGFATYNIVSFSYTIPASNVAGLHTITMIVNNDINGLSTTGLIVQATAVRVCESNAEIDPRFEKKK